MINQIYRKEGLAGLYSGFTINLLKVPLGQGLTFLFRGHLNRLYIKKFDNNYWKIINLFYFKIKREFLIKLLTNSLIQ